MDWVYVTRFVRTENNKDRVQPLIDENIRHWKDVSLDVGLDPEKNVAVEEKGSEVFIAISKDLDITLSEEPGEWK